MGSTKKGMLFTEAIGRESQSNEFPELEPFKMAAEELIEYLPHIYHSKIDTELEKYYQKVKTRTFAYENKNKCQIKRDHSSTRFSLAVSSILFRKLCRLCQISSGRDGRASKIGVSLRPSIFLTLSQTTKFRFFKPEKSFSWYDETSRKFSKRLENIVDKEKLIVTSNFSFSQSVFKRLVDRACLGKGQRFILLILTTGFMLSKKNRNSLTKKGVTDGFIQLHAGGEFISALKPACCLYLHWKQKLGTPAVSVSSSRYRETR